jgi:hypothetical protein
MTVWGCAAGLAVVALTVIAAIAGGGIAAAVPGPARVGHPVNATPDSERAERRGVRGQA